MPKLRYQAIENEEELYQLYSSPARINGQPQSIGVEESERLKEAAIFRGFTGNNGEPRSDVEWKEFIVVALRDATSPAGYNHEWWSQHASKPEWVYKLEQVVLETWLTYPKKAAELDTRKVANRLGYQLALAELMSGEAVSSEEFLREWERHEVEKEARSIPPELKDKSEVVMIGANSFEEFAKQTLENTAEVRRFVWEVAQAQDIEESTEFQEGFILGTRRAKKLFESGVFQQFEERQEVAEILQGYWMTIECCENLTEVSDFVLSEFPESKKEFFAVQPDAEAQFRDRLKKMYQRIGLRKTGPGRPRQNRET